MDHADRPRPQGAASARLTDNTIVIFTSDNGGERFSDTWPFTGRKTRAAGGRAADSRGNLLARPHSAGPDERPGAISMDWLPTLLAAAGTVPIRPTRPTGSNLLPVPHGACRACPADAVLALQGERPAGDARRRSQVPQDPRQHLPLRRRGRPAGARQPEGAPEGRLSPAGARSGSTGTRRCCRRSKGAIPADSAARTSRITMVRAEPDSTPDIPRPTDSTESSAP